jgi:hypothetical protein
MEYAEIASPHHLSGLEDYPGIAPEADMGVLFSGTIPILEAMRAAPGIHVEWVDNEAVVLDPTTQELHYLNATAAVVYALILEHGVEQAVATVLETIDGVDRDELDDLLAGMRESGLLVDD